MEEQCLSNGHATVVPQEAEVGNLWVSESERAVLCMDGVFTDLLGWTHEDLSGKPLSGLVVDGDNKELDLNLVSSTDGVAGEGREQGRERRVGLVNSVISGLAMPCRCWTRPWRCASKPWCTRPSLAECPK